MLSVPLLAILLGVPGPASGAGAVGAAPEACHAEFRAGGWTWYAVQPDERVRTTVASGCTAPVGPEPQVLFFAEGSKEIIACDQALALPPAMRAELEAAQLDGVDVLPSRSPTMDVTWRELMRKYSPLLRCAEGFRRMSDASSGIPSVWCRKQLTRRELCPGGTSFTDGSCSSLACPAGSVDLDRVSDGKLSGCSRCPAGDLDVAESVAWRDRSSWSSSRRGPVTAILCRARAAEPCPARPRARPAPAAPGRTGGG